MSPDKRLYACRGSFHKHLKNSMFPFKEGFQRHRYHLMNSSSRYFGSVQSSSATMSSSLSIW